MLLLRRHHPAQKSSTLLCKKSQRRLKTISLLILVPTCPFFPLRCTGLGTGPHLQQALCFPLPEFYLYYLYYLSNFLYIIFMSYDFPLPMKLYLPTSASRERSLLLPSRKFTWHSVLSFHVSILVPQPDHELLRRNVLSAV